MHREDPELEPGLEPGLEPWHEPRFQPGYQPGFNQPSPAFEVQDQNQNRSACGIVDNSCRRRPGEKAKRRG